MEQKLRTAIVEELRRQAEECSAVTVRACDDFVEVHGRPDMDALLAAISGAMSGWEGSGRAL